MGYLQQEEYLIFFYTDPRVESHWLVKLFCGNWYRHCGALGYNPEHDIWFGLEYTHKGVTQTMYTKEEISHTLDYLRHNNYPVLKVPVKPSWKLIWLKEHTCVSFIMRLIGYENWFIWTPKQLYCALKKNGIKSFWNDKN